VLQPTTSASPRGTTVKVFSIRSGSPRPGFSQTALPGTWVIAVHE
jgi:hypothetical protein